MRTIVIAGILLLSGQLSALYGQITLQECQQKARANYPLIQQYGLLEKSAAYNLSNAGKGYLPQLSLSAKATYQSEVTEIPIQLPGVETDMRKDQYQAVLELNQVIWDGGSIKAQKETVKTNSGVENQKLNVDMYTLNDRVNQLFFGILSIDEQLKQNLLLQQELQRNYENIRAYMENGIANQADLDAVKVEQLNTLQHQTELLSAGKSYRQMLSYMTGEGVNDSARLIEPVMEQEILSYEIKRPELSLFEAQHRQASAQQKILQAKNLPKFGLFAQGAYGNPGLNMLKNEFSFYYIAGARLSWNFGNLYTRKNEQRQIEVSQNSINIQQETFLFNTQLDITQESNEIEKMKLLMKRDEEIIRLRNNIKKSAEAKVANGTLTVTELLREITAEDQAKQNKALHKIQWLKAFYDLKNTTNN